MGKGREGGRGGRGGGEGGRTLYLGGGGHHYPLTIVNLAFIGQINAKISTLKIMVDV